MRGIAKRAQMKKMWLSLLLVSAGVAVLFSGPPILGMGVVRLPDERALAYGYSADVTVSTVVSMTTGSTSISCAGRCTYKAVYNGTFLTVYGKGFTPYEVIEFRLNEIYLGRSDTADANGDVVTWFKRWIPSGTYQLYAHEAHTAKNSNILTFVVTTSEPQTTTVTSASSSSSTSPSIIVEPSPGMVVDNYVLAAIVAASVAAMIVAAILVRRGRTSNHMKRYVASVSGQEAKCDQKVTFNDNLVGGRTRFWLVPSI
jgi:hypothetical protein